MRAEEPAADDALPDDEDLLLSGLPVPLMGTLALSWLRPP